MMEFARKVASVVAEGDDFLSQRQFPSRHQISSNFVAVADGFYKYFLYKFLNFFYTLTSCGLYALVLFYFLNFPCPNFW